LRAIALAASRSATAAPIGPIRSRCGRELHLQLGILRAERGDAVEDSARRFLLVVARGGIASRRAGG